MSADNRLKVTPFSSTVDSPFWVKYNQEKLERIRLSEDPIDLFATYGVEGPPRLRCQESSLQTSTNHANIPNERVLMRGKLIGMNTLEKFQKSDKNKILHDFFVQSFLDGNVDILTSFVLLTFADLKHHKVVYWFGIPALLNKNERPISVVERRTLSQTWTTTECEALAQQIQLWRSQKLSAGGGLPPYFMYKDSQCLELSKDSYLELGGDPSSIVFGCFDPIGIGVPANAPVGWPIRNLVAYLSFHLRLGGRNVTILSYRPKQMRRLTVGESSSLPPLEADGELLTIRVPERADYQWEEGGGYKVVGWELNARNKPGPRTVNLQPLLDARHLAIQAADLNLKLMKWRMIPDLQVENLQSHRVLLIGAGTLGCNVARVLVGWGIRKIKFIDNGKVSYSNPVRQPLFTLEDCAGDGRSKAEAAAEALRAVAADVESEGVVLSIPMPGHIEEKESIEKSVNELDALVQEADTIFLLTDTRESRWLPTVMAAAYDKVLFNAALGLDSWLVMRHGGAVGEGRLGCYFCNDVVAPENSTKNRTLDQQCTVTRPGLAPIASAMAVEMMVSLLHHPKGVKAPAPAAKAEFSPTVSSDDGAESALGIIPHQIRGSLVSYTMMTPTVPAFSHCTGKLRKYAFSFKFSGRVHLTRGWFQGCAQAVAEAYKKDRNEFVFQVCQSIDGSYLENVSGLANFRSLAAEKLAAEGDWDEDDFE